MEQTAILIHIHVPNREQLIWTSMLAHPLGKLGKSHERVAGFVLVREFLCLNIVAKRAMADQPCAVRQPRVLLNSIA